MKKIPEMFYTYVYLDPRRNGGYSYPDVGVVFDYEPFYVGKGHGRRMYVHIDHRGPNKHLWNRCQVIRSETGQPPLVVKAFADLKEFRAFELERRLISVIGRRDLGTGPLVNHNEGGTGNFNPSARVRNRISSSLKNWYSKNGASEIQREAVSKAMLGNKHLLGKCKGPENYWYGRDTKGSKNQHACNTYLASAPGGTMVFVAKGSLNQFCIANGLQEWSARNSANVFSKTGQVYVVSKGRAKGWWFVQVDEYLGNNPSDVTMGNQQLSRLVKEIMGKRKVQRLSLWDVGCKPIVTAETGSSLRKRLVI